LASTVWEPRIPRDAVTVFSGGTEGVLCPHVTFIVRAHDADADTSTGLLAAVGHTRALQPHEIGSPDHARIVATTVKAMMTDLGVHDGDVELVLIKCPLLTSAKLESIRAAGREPITTDTYESMAKSRYASAIGIAAALGEVADTQIEASLLLPQQPGTTAWSAKASCSSGAELDDNHILILASDPAAAAAAATPRTSTGEKTRRLLRIISRPMQDAIDASAVLALLSRVKEERGEVVQLFAKAEADPRGTIRGNRHTMNTDSDIHGTRHARAAVGGLLAGLVGDTQLYVSGGAEGQGPPGGGSLCVVYRTSL
jgi:cyanuric acid amidohydrolase